MRNTYSKYETASWKRPNLWDGVALVLVIGLLVLIGQQFPEMMGSYHVGDTLPISLDYRFLPSYAFRTVNRLFLAMLFSLGFTFSVGTLAAKSERAARWIIPVIDILQSVPILSFLSFAISIFFWLFKDSMLGPESAAIFGVFTAQVWNITLGFYQSLRSMPRELLEAGRMFHLSPWQSFWKIEVPYSGPSLIWNAMVSMSGSWFFVIACEAFSEFGQDVTLPGIGSYISLAIASTNHAAIWAAIGVMLLIILLYDQLIFRPLLYWADNFKEELDDDLDTPWVVELFQRGHIVPQVRLFFAWLAELFINNRLFNHPSKPAFDFITPKLRQARQIAATSFEVALALLLIVYGVRFLYLNLWRETSWLEVRHVMKLGLFTALRVISLVFLATLFWVPVGVWISTKPKIVKWVQPMLQFVAAFPANVLFPAATWLIIRYHLNVEFWVAPLMILGTQWYILFNIIAGMGQLPTDLWLVTKNFQIQGWLKWRRVILPHIAPYLVTGVITAAGGAWNASIIAETIVWGETKLRATGLGSYIEQSFVSGDARRLILGTTVMCLFVLLLNRLVWQPLYNYVIERFN